MENHGGNAPSKWAVYRFQHRDTLEIYEVSAEDAAQALRRCHHDRKWPLDRVIYLGLRKNGSP